MTLPTDLYCEKHERFLPFAGAWREITRSAVIWVSVALVFAGLALSGDLDSWIPAFLAAGLIGLGAVALPLRNFAMTVTVVVVLWATAMTIALVYHVAGPHADAVIIAALLVTAGSLLGLHSGFFAVVNALDEEVVPKRSRQPRPASAIALVAGILAVAGTAVVTFLAFLVTPMPFRLDETAARAGTLTLAVVALATAAVAALVAGLVDGLPRVSDEPPTIDGWDGIAPRTWTANPKAVEYHAVTGSLDRIHELLRRAAIRLRNALLTVAVALARTTVNLVAAALRGVVNVVIQCLDVVVAAVHVLVRLAWETAVSTVSILFHAADVALRYVGFALVVLGLPLLALGAAAGILPGLAEEIRRYLVGGSLTTLAAGGLSSAAGLCALTVAWLVTAGQRLPRSLRSAGLAATLTAPYVVALTALGGWVIGLPGTLGYGRVHVGWVTIVSTSILVAALVWSRLPGRSRPGPGVAEVARPVDPV